MKKTVALLPGDGIGPEVMQCAVSVLEAALAGSDFELEYLEDCMIGGAAYDEFGAHFPDSTLEHCQSSDAILFGSVGGPIDQAHLPKWRGCEANSLLALRKAFSFNANLRPAVVYPELAEFCPIKLRDGAKIGLDLLIVRELLGDIYFGEHRTDTVNGIRVARDVAEYTEAQICSIAKVAFKAAEQRNGRLTSVDKANVLDTSRLWREVVTEVSRDFPNVQLSHILVDNCAMQLILDPAQFDVLLAPNMFGDILSDAAAVLPGSLGLMPSASFSAAGFAMYEPSGGSAPDLVGRDVANPIAQILSGAMMLDYSFARTKEAASIKAAVVHVLAQGYRTADIHSQGKQLVGTKKMTELIIEAMISLDGGCAGNRSVL